MMLRTGRITRLLLFAVIGFITSASSGSAATVKYQTDAELIANSSRIVRARVLGSRGDRGPGGRIYTITTLEVLEDFSGEDDAILEIRELGGRVGSDFLFVGGMVYYEPGSEVVVCLERSAAGWLRSIALGFSKFDVAPTADGDALLRRNTVNIEVAGGREPGPPARLSEFRQLAERVRGRRSVKPRRSAEEQSLLSAQEPYTLLTFPFNGRPGRWIEADTGTPVRWYIDTTAAPPVPGDAVPELQTALAGWTNPSQASIVLTVGGFTDQVDTAGPWPALGNAAGVIFFEDPEDDINGNVLAVGGATGSENDGGTVNGTLFNRLRSGFVMFQNAANLPGNFRQSTDFTRVLEHEVGHGIGLGHTQDSVPNATSNIMYPSCCTPSTPVPPAIGPDDLAGLMFIYPVSGCTYSISSNSTQVPALASSFNVTVTTQNGCGWTVTGNPPWVTVNPLSGTGDGTVQVSTSTNATTSGRTVTLTIAGETHTVTQAACTCSVSPTAASVAATGGPISVSVAANSCNWTALSPVNWIVITGGLNGSGAGTVTLSVGRNVGPPRSALVRVAGQLVNVSQPEGTSNTTAADFNGDGRADLVWHHQNDGRISVWNMNSVNMMSGTLLTPDRVSDTHWKIVGVWDPDGDGYPDLLWRHDANGSVANWRMQGTTRVSGDPLSPAAVADTDWQIAAVADLNRDGRPDIVWQHVTQGLISVWLMNGTTAVEGRLLTPGNVTDTDWRIVGSGDFNLDGYADLVWQHRVTGQASVWFMNGTTRISGTLLTPAGVGDINWQIRAVTDLDNDGQPDLVWQNVSTGYLAAWLMNGTTRVQGIYLSPAQVADTGWRVAGPR
jgi:VCBS repeat protein/all-beta uncharacterized protein/FG-GAP repeat protein